MSGELGVFLSGDPDPRSEPPRNEKPVIIPTEQVFVVDEKCVVFISHIGVYSTGVILDVECRLRGVGDRIPFSPEHFRSAINDESRAGLRVGLRHSAGPVSDEIFVIRNPAENPSEKGGQVALTILRASIEDASCSLRYWLWPLTKASDIVLFVEWPERSLQYHEWRITEPVIAAARSKIVTFW
jgi:hypothetical protein